MIDLKPWILTVDCNSCACTNKVFLQPEVDMKAGVFKEECEYCFDDFTFKINYRMLYILFATYGQPGMALICEYCKQKPFHDVHHMEEKGMGGKTESLLEDILHLMGLCRDCHDEYHYGKDSKITKERLYVLHNEAVRLMLVGEWPPR